MTTPMYLGYPPANIVDWIRTHSQSPAAPSPYFTYDSNRVITGLYQGSPNIQGEGGWTYGGGSNLNENYATAIGDDAFNDHDYQMGDILFSKAIAGNITFQNITRIGDNAFADCYNLTSIMMPNVTSIGEYAFSNCESLTGVIMPNVTSIGERAFIDCRGLMTVTIPNGVTSIEMEAFSSCSELTSVTIGSGIQRIGANAFDTYGNPITLTIGKTVAEVQAMGTTGYDSNTNVPYSEWGLPAGSTIVCTNGTITI